MNTIGRAEERQNPFSSSSIKLVGMIREPFSGLHQGQRSCAPHQQAGHMTAPDLTVPSVHFSLATQGPSTHDENRCWATGFRCKTEAMFDLRFSPVKKIPDSSALARE